MRAAERVLRDLYDATENETLTGAADQPAPVRIRHRCARREGGRRRAGRRDQGQARHDPRPRRRTRQRYLHAIATHDINFGVGPAGTGKTYLAVAMAVDALNDNRVQRLVLVRPAVEAGEKLGFLPGDLTQKVDPYLRPLYDALYEMLGIEKVMKLIERNVIEIAPLAYMRGRTLNDSFVILDEAQNTTIEQMKMFLTRIGFGSVAVVTGDMTQTDLPRHVKSGLRDAIEVLRDVDGVSFTFFTAHDVVRHPLVQRIVRAYEKRDEADGRRAAVAMSQRRCTLDASPCSNHAGAQGRAGRRARSSAGSRAALRGAPRAGRAEVNIALFGDARRRARSTATTAARTTRRTC